jgi:hypothetical protein
MTLRAFITLRDVLVRCAAALAAPAVPAFVRGRLGAKLSVAASLLAHCGFVSRY